MVMTRRCMGWDGLHSEDKRTRRRKIVSEKVGQKSKNSREYLNIQNFPAIIESNFERGRRNRVGHSSTVFSRIFLENIPRECSSPWCLQDFCPDGSYALVYSTLF